MLFWKLDAHAILEDARLEVSSYALPHNRTVPDGFDVLREALVSAPLGLASLLALALPTIKFVEDLESTQGDVGGDEIDECVAKSGAAFEVAWKVEKIVMSSEAMQIK